MSGKIKLLALLLVAALGVAACSRDKEQPKQSPVKPEQTAKRPSAPPPPPPEILPVTGKVLEILDTGGFIYVSLDWNGKQVWAAVPGVELKIGEMISLDHATMFPNFHSNALNRTFKELIFASGVVGKSPRSRAANSTNPRDPKNRRSGKILAAPLPAPPKPSGKAGQ